MNETFKTFINFIAAFLITALFYFIGRFKGSKDYEHKRNSERVKSKLDEIVGETERSREELGSSINRAESIGDGINRVEERVDDARAKLEEGGTEADRVSELIAELVNRAEQEDL